MAFDVEKSQSCYKDYLLTALDGSFPSKYAVERECGYEMSPKVFKDRAWFEYVTDDTVNTRGINVRWKAQRITTTKSTTTTVSSM